jgi:hypothetical protein
VSKVWLKWPLRSTGPLSMQPSQPPKQAPHETGQAWAGSRGSSSAASVWLVQRACEAPAWSRPPVGEYSAPAPVGHFSKHSQGEDGVEIHRSRWWMTTRTWM